VDTRRFASIFGVMLVVGGFAGAGAYLVTRTYLADAAAATPTNGTNADPTTTRPGAGVTTGGGGAPGDPGATCPALTSAAVKSAGRKGDLTRVLYVDGTRAGTDGAEAWICRDADGTLYYQGHDKGGPFDAATSSSTILIGPGVRGTVVMSGVGFTATNPSNGGTTQYIVTRETLAVVLPSGERQEYRVTRYLPNS
jgi:hypothetical protein